jgi:hypothetical protein
VHGRWYGVRGHRFVRPALIVVTGDGAERRLLADLDDKPWVAEDGESWRAAFAVESEEDLDAAVRLELSVAPDINIELRRAGVTADGPITATGRVSEEPPARRADAPPADPDLPFPTPPRHRRARGVPRVPKRTPGPTAPDTATEATAPAAGTAADAAEAAVDAPAAASPDAPHRRRPVANRVADIERLTARLRAAEETLEREQARRQEVEQALERDRSEARRTVAELARVRAELELARTAEHEAADTVAQLDAARRELHELRARHEALRADHDRTLHAQAELEETLETRSTELKASRQELSDERRQRREADSRAEAATEAAHRAPQFHTTIHTPPPPRTDRPLNPSLRRSPWLRLLVVIVIAGVLLAVYLVLHSTVLH